MKRIVWSETARLDVRRLDRDFIGLQRFAETGEGDIKRLRGSNDFRLRVGDWRVRFSVEPEDSLQIHSVRNRSEGYR